MSTHQMIRLIWNNWRLCLSWGVSMKFLLFRISIWSSANWWTLACLPPDIAIGSAKVRGMFGSTSIIFFRIPVTVSCDNHRCCPTCRVENPHYMRKYYLGALFIDGPVIRSTSILLWDIFQMTPILSDTSTHSSRILE